MAGNTSTAVTFAPFRCQITLVSWISEHIEKEEHERKFIETSLVEHLFFTMSVATKRHLEFFTTSTDKLVRHRGNTWIKTLLLWDYSWEKIQNKTKPLNIKWISARHVVSADCHIGQISNTVCWTQLSEDTVKGRRFIRVFGCHNYLIKFKILWVVRDSCRL